MVTPVETVVVLAVLEIAKNHVLARALERVKLSVLGHVNTVVLEVVHPSARDLVQDVAETARTHVKVDALETLEMHQIHVDADPHVHLHVDLHVLMNVPMVVGEIVATNVPQHAQTRVLEIARELLVGVLI